MDLGLYSRVLWRHKIIVTLGIVAAAFLALLSVVRVEHNGFKYHGLAYRGHEQWVSYEKVLVTQPGFTEGSLNSNGDPMRLVSLAIIYSQFVGGDAIAHQVWPTGRHEEHLEAAPVLALPGSSSAGALPIISIAGFSDSGRKAQLLTARAATALTAYIGKRQESAHVPVAERVRLSPVARALDNAPVLWQGRSKTLPIVILLTVLIATMGLAFVLENLNPQIRTLPEEEPILARRHSSAS